MTADWLSLWTLLAALGSGLIAGVFFAFSSFVMRALSALPSQQGIAAMQSINVAVLNPVFLSLFCGTALAAAALCVAAWLRWGEPGAVPLMAAGVLYIAGCFLVTVACNVPLNNALAAADPHSASGANTWALYLRDWVRWNHVRTAAALAASAGFMLASHQYR